MGSSEKSGTSESMDSASSPHSTRIRAALLAKQRIEGVLENKKRLSEMLNRRAFLRRCGSSKSMEATLDSMEMELSDFEKAIGREILGPPEPGKDDGKSVFSFDLATRALGKKRKAAGEMESRELHNKAVKSDEAGENKSSTAESKSIASRGSMSNANKSVATRKASNAKKVATTKRAANVMVPDLPDLADASDSDSYVSEDDDELEVSPEIEYQESDSNSTMKWIDRFIREGDFCIDYAFRLMDCDPTEMYAQTKAAMLGTTHPDETENEAEQEDGKKVEVEKPEEEKPKKRKWFRLPGTSNKDHATIELKDADPALDDLTDSDSWNSADHHDDDSSGRPPENYQSKLLTSNPEEYFAMLAASSKSSNRAEDRNEMKHDQRSIMCEI